jgi:hypothetical protein
VGQQSIVALNKYAGSLSQPNTVQLPISLSEWVSIFITKLAPFADGGQVDVVIYQQNIQGP